MKIETLTWEKVVVSCPRNSECEDSFSNATLIFMPDMKGLQIQEMSHRGRSALYAKAKLESLTPMQIVFKACWWSDPVEGDTTYIPVTITATF